MGGRPWQWDARGRGKYGWKKAPIPSVFLPLKNGEIDVELPNKKGNPTRQFSLTSGNSSPLTTISLSTLWCLGWASQKEKSAEVSEGPHFFTRALCNWRKGGLNKNSPKSQNICNCRELNTNLHLTHRMERWNSDYRRLGFRNKISYFSRFHK